MWGVSYPLSSQPAASIPDCEKRGESVYGGGGAGKQALSPSSLPHQQHTHPDGPGAGFRDAKAPESARGILAECVLENVRPTGNKGLPLTILQVGGELREQGVGGNRGPACKGLGVRGCMHTEGNSW